MLESLTSNVTLWVAGGATGIVLWVLKKIPNETICNIVETTFYGLGRTCTLGLAKWTWSKGVWNKTVEPYIVDAIDNIFGSMVRGMIKGLKSDNK